VLEPGYLAVQLPKLNVVAVKKLFCPFHRRRIVDAVEWNHPVKTAIRTDDANPVFRHLLCRLRDQSPVLDIVRNCGATSLAR
jgi:hypothetical protein